MNANILRLLGLIGGYSAMSSKKEDERENIKNAEIKALSNYENSPAHEDITSNDPDYDYGKFAELRRKIRTQK